MPVREYQKRAYCKAIQCPVQLELDKSSEGAREYERARETCKSACLRSAEHFQGWLAGAGFAILGADGKAVGRPALDGIAARAGTAWLFHHAVSGQGMRVVQGVR